MIPFILTKSTVFMIPSFAGDEQSIVYFFMGRLAGSGALRIEDMASAKEVTPFKNIS